MRSFVTTLLVFMLLVSSGSADLIFAPDAGEISYPGIAVIGSIGSPWIPPGVGVSQQHSFGAAGGFASLDTVTGDITHEGYSFTFPGGSASQSWSVQTGISTSETVTFSMELDPFSLSLNSPQMLTPTVFFPNGVGYSGIPESEFSFTSNVSGSWEITGDGTHTGSFNVPVTLSTSQPKFAGATLTRDASGKVTGFFTRARFVFEGTDGVGIFNGAMYGHPMDASLGSDLVILIEANSAAIPEPSALLYSIIAGLAACCGLVKRLWAAP